MISFLDQSLNIVGKQLKNYINKLYFLYNLQLHIASRQYRKLKKHRKLERYLNILAALEFASPCHKMSFSEKLFVLKNKLNYRFVFVSQKFR